MKKFFEEPIVKTTVIIDITNSVVPGSSTQDPEEW